MTVCNSCRYCEQYCPVFPAMERLGTFGAEDLAYLANLCHNCGECLYACQYAPPHAFGIDVPRLFAEIRLESYEDHAWPRPMARWVRRHGPRGALALAGSFSAIFGVATGIANPDAFATPPPGADFYAVVPHAVMVALFGAVAGFVVLALVQSGRLYARTIGLAARPAGGRAIAEAVFEGVTLAHLHGTGAHCVSGEETRTPWRRWAHHATLGGFALTFASTSVAALYHVVFGWEAPHAITSLPVLLGTAGGIGLVVGLAGQWWLRERRDPALSDPAQRGLDDALLLLLWLTSVTGLALLALRHTAVMPWLLVLHLGVVLAFFVTLPYGKFVHGLYRIAALTKHAAERADAPSGHGA